MSPAEHPPTMSIRLRYHSGWMSLLIVAESDLKVPSRSSESLGHRLVSKMFGCFN